MSRVTLNEGAPVAGNAVTELMGHAAQEVVVTDAQGRKITLKKPGILAQYRLVEALGAERADNNRLYMMVMPLTYVAAIDGDPVVLPANYLQMEALIQRLDEAGLEAVMKGAEAHWGPADAEATRQALKNS